MSIRNKYPWFVRKSDIHDYRIKCDTVEDVAMLKVIKTIRWIILNIIIAGIALFAMNQGGDPTVISSVAIIALSFINGVELSDWIVAREVIEEMRQGRQ